ncbi:hypothetical protein NLA05_21420, partial [Xanthomonas citri pv. anacardii]|uniref:hypothetical protein n=1 Tax=Xanthomonas citri TaxID=346 RepID=UPI0021C15AB2
PLRFSQIGRDLTSIERLNTGQHDPRVLLDGGQSLQHLEFIDFPANSLITNDRVLYQQYNVKFQRFADDRRSVPYNKLL